MSRLLKRLRWPVTVSAVFAAAVGAFMAYIAIQHNPQEEYCMYETAQAACSIRMGPVAELAVVWSVPSFVVALLITVSVSERLRIANLRAR
jgi:hypothetical protein